MITPFATLVLIGFVTALVAFLGMALLGMRDETEDRNEEPARPLFGGANGALAGLLPSTASGRQAIQQDLWMAGYSQPIAVNNFLVIRNLFTIVPIVAGLASALTAEDTRLSLDWLGLDYRPPLGLAFAALGLIFGLLGYSIPRLVLRSLAGARRERIERGMPALLDTLALTLSSGGGLAESLRRSGESIRRGHVDLSNEVRTVSRQADLHSLDLSLKQWKNRIPISEVSSLVFLLTSTDRYGSSVTEGLHELSTNYRVTARQRAEATANRTSFYMLFPTVLCLLIAAGLMLIGPPLHRGLQSLPEVENHFKEMSSQKNDLQKEFERLTNSRRGTVADPASATPAVPEP